MPSSSAGSQDDFVSITSASSSATAASSAQDSFVSAVSTPDSLCHDVSKISLDPFSADCLEIVHDQSSMNFVASDFQVTGAITVHDPSQTAPIQINIQITSRTTSELVRVAGVHFHCAGVSVSNKPFVISDAEVIVEEVPGKEDKKWFINFKYKEAVLFGVNTNTVSKQWPHRVVLLLRSLRRYFEDGFAKIELTNLLQYPDSLCIAEDLSQTCLSKPAILSDRYLAGQSMIDGLRVPLSKYEDVTAFYRSRIGKINKDVSKYPAVHSYSSPEEALIKITHGCFIDAWYERLVSSNIFHGHFEATFLETESRAVLAAIRKKDGTWDKNRHNLGSDTNVAVFLQGRLYDDLQDEADNDKKDETSDGKKDESGGDTEDESEYGSQDEIDHHSEDERRKPRGKLWKKKPLFGPVIDKAGLKVECDFVLLLDKNTIPAKMNRHSQPLKQVQSSRDCFFLDVRLELKDYDQAKLQIEAVNSFFSRGGKYNDLWPSFMGICLESDDKEQPKNFLKEKLGCTQTDIDKVLGKVKDKLRAAELTLNQEQQSILDNIGQSHHGWTLWCGPPGTGKSTTIALMVYALLQFPGVGVYACAPSNGSTSKLFGNISEWMKLVGVDDANMLPLRVFRKYSEITHLRSILFPRNDNRTDAARKVKALSQPVTAANVEIDWYTRSLMTNEKKLMDNPDNGLMAATLQAIKANFLPEYVGAGPTRGDSKAARKQQSAYRRAIMKSLPTLNSKMKDQNLMIPRGDIQANVESVSEQVLADRRCVASTVNNATNLLLRDAIFRDSKAVVIIVDEASLDTDHAILGLVAGIINDLRIDEYDIQPPVVQVILVGDDMQGRPVMKSAQDGVNTFGPQAKFSPFERMKQVGVPVQTLFVQHRMAPVLRKLPSSRCYGGLLRDAEEVKTRKLKTLQALALTDLMQERINCSGNPIDMNDFLRFTMLDVKDGIADQDQTTKSRFNQAYLDVTIQLVTFLIKRKVVSPKELVIITLWNGQKTKYIRELVQLEKTLKLPPGELDGCIETSDSFQGRERTCVIFDTVVSAYEGLKKLGNAGDERRINVACTRARDLFFVVGRLDMLDSRFISQTERKPYLLDLLSTLKAHESYVSGTKKELMSKLESLSRMK